MRWISIDLASTLSSENTGESPCTTQQVQLWLQ